MKKTILLLATILFLAACTTSTTTNHHLLSEGDSFAVQDLVFTYLNGELVAAHPQEEGRISCPSAATEIVPFTVEETDYVLAADRAGDRCQVRVFYEERVSSATMTIRDQHAVNQGNFLYAYTYDSQQMNPHMLQIIPTDSFAGYITFLVQGRTHPLDDGTVVFVEAISKEAITITLQ